LKKGIGPMQQRVQSAEATDAVSAAPGPTPVSASRRWLLGALPGVAIGVVALIGLTSCGGEDDEEDDDD
jgi:hypothetical protein